MAATPLTGHGVVRVFRDLEPLGRRAARDLTAAINGQLLDRDAQLYVLNIDAEGRLHTDVTAGLHPVALADEDRILAGLGGRRKQAVTAPVRLDGLLEADARYRLSRYSSERGEWEGTASGSGGDFSVMGVRAEALGY